MKVKTLQIVWHDKEPVYSLDFLGPDTLATAGGDKEIKIWHVSSGEDGHAKVEHKSTLTGHSKTVNCVRFSPDGRQMASSSDAGELLLWQPVDSSSGAKASREFKGAESEDESCAPTWRRSAVLRGHADDILDLAWSSDGSALVSGSIDNKALVWDAGDKRRGALLAQLAGHRHFVQGVAWDPAGRFVATQSADRTCKIFGLRPPAAGKRARSEAQDALSNSTARDLYCCATLSRRSLAEQVEEPNGEKEVGARPERVPLFQDESVSTFFRRLAWAPDGSCLVAPLGVCTSPVTGRDAHTLFLWARGRWTAPLMHFPGHSKPVVAIRFCPVLFELPAKGHVSDEASLAPPREAPEDLSDVPPSPFTQTYAMVFAAATLDSVAVYSTAQAAPLALLGALHYDSITDLAWSSDARFLAVSSRDCYCSVAHFQAGEL
ncbi:hypothetical protein H632_c2051p0, partial [Helicosporidium sp. ATCC 50920]